MALTPEQSKALAADIVANMAKYRVNQQDKINEAIDMRIERAEQNALIAKERAESMARRKAAMDETFHDSSYVNNRGYGEGRKMGD